MMATLLIFILLTISDFIASNLITTNKDSIKGIDGNTIMNKTGIVRKVNTGSSETKT